MASAFPMSDTGSAPSVLCLALYDTTKPKLPVHTQSPRHACPPPPPPPPPPPLMLQHPKSNANKFCSISPIATLPPPPYLPHLTPPLRPCPAPEAWRGNALCSGWKTPTVPEYRTRRALTV
ncbi:hypothetical protein PMIN06_000724 [Paraphaeosphaeria minitans]|uniref:Uncharacterized protein n=1 Tax=Paraphaeosphaeria minitans TaxID=565426 RepID=A0A9P6KQ71_9PLEO|nr:hypothetical protein PMIN01_07715 [Paraphaeosphaeria minitans]